jgi:hypothetical protein
MPLFFGAQAASPNRGAVLFVPLVFDEASSIHMAGLLNVFVKKITPELKGRIMMLLWTLVFVIILTCMVPFHAKVETVGGDFCCYRRWNFGFGIESPTRKNVFAPRLHRFLDSKVHCRAVHILYFTVPP